MFGGAASPVPFMTRRFESKITELDWWESVQLDHILTPQIGQRFSPGKIKESERWWREF